MDFHLLLKANETLSFVKSVLLFLQKKAFRGHFLFWD